MFPFCTRNLRHREVKFLAQVSTAKEMVELAFEFCLLAKPVFPATSLASVFLSRYLCGGPIWEGASKKYKHPFVLLTKHKCEASQRCNRTLEATSGILPPTRRTTDQLLHHSLLTQSSPFHSSVVATGPPLPTPL